jgi:hypothetical protein
MAQKIIFRDEPIDNKIEVPILVGFYSYLAQLAMKKDVSILLINQIFRYH